MQNLDGKLLTQVTEIPSILHCDVEVLYVAILKSEKGGKVAHKKETRKTVFVVDSSSIRVHCSTYFSV